MSKVNLKDILKEVLEENKVPNIYSLNGYAEEAICMEKSEHCFCVYEAERGNKYNQKNWTREVDAIYDLITRVSSNNEQEKKMKFEFAEKVSLELYK